MKKLFYALFAFFFRVGRLLPVKADRVSLLSPHNGGKNGSLDEIKRYLTEKGGYEIIEITPPKAGSTDLSSLPSAVRFFIIESIRLATSGFVFLNDNFMPMANLNFSEKTIITQLWHGEGAFKKFGLMTDLPDDVCRREKECSSKLSFVVCTSENVVPVYAEAFGVPEEKVIPLGSPRVDYLIREKDNTEIRGNFDKAFPQCRGRKLVLYAPTFRDDEKRDGEILSHFDFDSFSSEFGEEYALLVKLHPQVRNSRTDKEIIDVSDMDIAELTIICDILITDYSSVCMNFALLSKPCIFYAYDIDEYEDERSFCFGFEEYVPGPVAKNPVELMKAMKNPRNDEKINRFREFNFDYIDCGNTGRVIEYVMPSNPQ